MASKRSLQSQLSISIMRTLTLNSAFALSAFLLGGCSTFGTHIDQLPDGGPTTKEVYEGHMGMDTAIRPAGTVPPPDGRIARNPGDPTAWTRGIDNEFSLRFPRIPNHELHGYVFPHLTAKGRPVPGYSTSFPLYETIHYALPGEVSPGAGVEALQ